MSTPLKVLLYVVLATLAGISGYFALSSFSRLMDQAGNRLERLEPDQRRRAEAPPDEAAAVTNTAATNAVDAALTNAPSLATATNEASLVVSNTNAVTATASNTPPEQTASVAAAAPPVSSAPANARVEKTTGRIGLWSGVFVLSVVGLGLMIARDISGYMGNKALKMLYNDEGEGQGSPDYEKAEEVWAQGDHLEAIRLMRDYLAKNPREQHAAIRIAEIYEKDLKNNLAAALEYEEVLKHKLPAERWGWAAVHLCNLYFRLNQEQKGFALLRRIVHEYPDTAAAEKARKRLEQVGEAPAAEQMAAENRVSPRPEPPSQTGSSNLPPGFRPKR